MKHLLVIPSGLAEPACAELDGRTPLEVARTPALDGLALRGRLGRVVTCPPPLPVRADIGLLCLLGYDPALNQAGRGALETWGLGHEVFPGDWVLRLSFLCVKNGVVSAVSHVRDAEAAAILGAFASRLRMPGSVIRTGAEGRHLLVQPALSGTRYDWDALVTFAPHEAVGRPLADCMPAGGNLAAVLSDAVGASADFLSAHEINLTRLEMGELPITHLWPWGQGRLPGLRPLPELLHLRAAMVAEPGLAVGLARAAGMSAVLPTPNGSPAALALAAARALSQSDLVVVRARVNDTESDGTGLAATMAGIESFDRDLLAPLVHQLETIGQPWRILVAPDHLSSSITGRHPAGAVPFVMAGHRVPHVVDAPFSEASCAQSDLHIQQGHLLMEYFLKSGLNPDSGGY